MYSEESVRYLQLAAELLDDIVIPSLDVAPDEETFVAVTRKFFSERDNTVEDAATLARMLAVTLASIAIDYNMPITRYAKEVSLEYKRRISQELN